MPETIDWVREKPGAPPNLVVSRRDGRSSVPPVAGSAPGWIFPPIWTPRVKSSVQEGRLCAARTASRHGWVRTRKQGIEVTVAPGSRDHGCMPVCPLQSSQHGSHAVAALDGQV